MEKIKESDEFDKELMAEEPPKKIKKKALRPAQTIETMPESQLETEAKDVLQEKEANLLRQVFEKMSAMEQAYIQLDQKIDLAKRRISETLESQGKIEKKINLVREEKLGNYTALFNQIGERLENANESHGKIKDLFVEYETKREELRRDYAMGPRRNATDYCMDCLDRVEKNFSEMMPALREIKDKMAAVVELMREEIEQEEGD